MTLPLPYGFSDPNLTPRDPMTPLNIIHYYFDINMDYTYRLQKYTGRNSRHTCPACGRKFCFTLYVNAAGNPIAENVGRCEHRNSCGYEKTPKMYFDENPTERKEFRPMPTPQPKKEEKTDYIPFSLIQQSESTNNTLMDYLRKYFTDEALNKITADYHLGSSKKREVIFPQIDRAGMCRTGKVINYGADGHRIKGQMDAVDWLHARLMKKQGKQAFDFHLRQCLFGEHLLPKRPHDIVCLVESEKSAIICSIVFPQFVWVSCGGKQGFTSERCRSLAGRNVIVYADADAVVEWQKKTITALAECRSVSFSNWYKDEAPDSHRDIADLVMQERKPLEKPTTIGDICQWLDELGIEKGRVAFNL